MPLFPQPVKGRKVNLCTNFSLTLFSHNHLQQLKGSLVLTDVIRHVAIRIDSQQIGPTESTHIHIQKDLS